VWANSSKKPPVEGWGRGSPGLRKTSKKKEKKKFGHIAATGKKWGGDLRFAKNRYLAWGNKSFEREHIKKNEKTLEHTALSPKEE